MSAYDPSSHHWEYRLLTSYLPSCMGMNPRLASSTAVASSLALAVIKVGSLGKMALNRQGTWRHQQLGPRRFGCHQTAIWDATICKATGNIPPAQITLPNN